MPGDDPADLQPLVHDQRRPGDPGGGAEGVIVAEADHLGGFSLFVQDGKLKHTYSMMGVLGLPAGGGAAVARTGSVNVRLEFAADAPRPATGGQVTLFVNDEPVGGGRMDHTVPFRFSGYAGMDIGRDNGLPVERGYADKVAVRLHRHDQEGRLRHQPAPDAGGRVRPRARPEALAAAHSVAA